MFHCFFLGKEGVKTFLGGHNVLYLKTGVQIFSSRHPEDQMQTQEVLALLEKYPLALLLYLEFLIYDIKSEVGVYKFF